MTAAQFEALTADLPYLPKGMFYSELYLFTVHCLTAGVVHIIESGVRNGVSTRVLRALWPNGVCSVDLKPWRSPVDLQPYIITGDGRQIVPLLVNNYVRTSVGVLLDGPKGSKGDMLRRQLWESPHVKVVAQHDSPRGRGETIHSWDETFRRDIGEALDRRIPAEIRAHYLSGCPGLGIWVRT